MDLNEATSSELENYIYRYSFNLFETFGTMASSVESGNSLSNSEAFSGIYFYTYVLITAVIIAGAYHFVGKIRLSFQAYSLLQEMEEHLSIIEIAKQGLVIKLQCLTNSDPQKEIFYQRKFKKVKNLTGKSARKLIKETFNKMRELLDSYEEYLVSEVDRIDDEITSIQTPKVDDDDDTLQGKCHIYVVVCCLKPNICFDCITLKQSTHGNITKFNQTKNFLLWPGYILFFALAGLHFVFKSLFVMTANSSYSTRRSR